jgi:hypothetical protein
MQHVGASGLRFLLCPLSEKIISERWLAAYSLSSC